MKVAFFAVVMLIVLLFATPMQVATHQTLTLGDVKDAILKKGAEWTANATSVWTLPWQAKRLLANAKTPPSKASSSSYTVQVDPGPPGEFDWRSTSGGRDFTTPIRDQGACGSCYIFGSVAVFESLLRMRQGTGTSGPDLSEQYVLSGCHSCGSCQMGGYAYRVFDFVQTHGLPIESCSRYVADSNVVDGARCEAAANIAGWGLVPPSVEDIRTYLLAYGPLASWMAVYEDFFAYSGGIYQHVVGGYVGGHFVAIVGYDDAGGYWIAKNSWGTGWGEQGWFRIAYGDSGIGSYVLYGSMAGSAPGSISGFSVTITAANPGTTGTNSTMRRID